MLLMNLMCPYCGGSVYSWLNYPTLTEYIECDNENKRCGAQWDEHGHLLTAPSDPTFRLGARVTDNTGRSWYSFKNPDNRMMDVTIPVDSFWGVQVGAIADLPPELLPEPVEETLSE